jgi:hypothetical protein
MRRRARTDLCGGRSVMAVPTATGTREIRFKLAHGVEVDSALDWISQFRSCALIHSPIQLPGCDAIEALVHDHLTHLFGGVRQQA